MAGLVVMVMLAASACRGSRIPSTVTCEALRAMKLGMAQESVERLLGPPVDRTGRPTAGVRGGDEAWFYSGGNHDPFYLFSHSDKMQVDFSNRRLIRVAAVRKLGQFPPEPMLFFLEEETAPDGTHKEVRLEGRLFVEAFCPDGAPKAE